MNPFKDKIVGVLMGGLSKEREVSLRSGGAVLDALLLRGYDAVPIDVGADIAEQLKKKEIEVAFLALHGRYGEDGCIQGLLEIAGIPYTGSSVLASALAMDKHLTKDIARQEGLPTPDSLFFDAFHEDLDAFLAKFCLSFPLIVKPSREGSTIGIAKVENARELKSAIHEAAQLDSRVLVEKFVQGREVTVPVLNQEPLPVLEVVPKSGFYDYASKYTAGATTYICPAEIGEAATKLVQDYAKRIYRRIGCEGVARADFIIGEDQVPYFLEINTLPGMTATSLVPKSAAATGMSFEDLVEKILATARVKIQ
ncbi:D-alanine--D-alanine ligase [Deltaproteobacteria bacterium PRO3]|nr:D-alanine--D-alanine ligase [Deltaproteobacteria bacterium PRO3]